MLNATLAAELMAMEAADLALRQELVEIGVLSDSYHPRMEQLHIRHGERLAELISVFGFPGRSLVGDDGAQAAWMILQHAISMPALQRAALSQIEALAETEEMPWSNAAMLQDRIRYLEGKRQLFGTQFDWDENGELSPLPIEDEAAVDMRRLAVGLPSLAASINQQRDIARRNGELPPRDRETKRHAFEAWATRVGWRREASP